MFSEAIKESLESQTKQEKTDLMKEATILIINRLALINKINCDEISEETAAPELEEINKKLDDIQKQLEKITETRKNKR